MTPRSQGARPVLRTYLLRVQLLCSERRLIPTRGFAGWPTISTRRDSRAPSTASTAPQAAAILYPAKVLGNRRIIRYPYGYSIVDF